MGQCRRCGDEAGLTENGGPADYCSDCFTILRETGQRPDGGTADQRIRGMSSHVLMEDTPLAPGVDPVPLGGDLRKVVAHAHNQLVRSGAPIGAETARVVVELALLRAMASTSTNLSFNAACRLSAIYGLDRRAKSATADVDTQEPLDEAGEAEADNAAAELARRLGVSVS